jgi:hypothetical protein
VLFQKCLDFLASRGVYEATDRSSRLNLASSVTGKNLVTDSEETLHEILATLEECQAALMGVGHRETAQLLSVAVLELRIKLNRIDESELKALCDVIVRDDGPADSSRAIKALQNQRGRPPILKLVK